ncbi:valine--tRNA ligase, mitochondrial 1 isoform X2 [Hevea brasiliensis]|uniref:valine--tRNA ligase, mitochondrial 1 isoform X2 n=1 Tax=Hevea brasiliensis TaxID=3981 RepID=UPI0025FA4A86|nr:valine--tRNA ligase, mitochondrial 1 isoform X2 [Hevea brasiliensis]XP_057995472.1 valine--tRNA ligase, mitochondrial 1 isoform X2 [Hevea brasiliensis]
MPFITEELWQCLPPAGEHTRKESIMISEYPSTVEAWTNERLEYEMDLVEATVKCIRSLRAEVLGNPKNERLPVFAFCQSDAVAETIASHELEISTLATLSSFQEESLRRSEIKWMIYKSNGTSWIRWLMLQAIKKKYHIIFRRRMLKSWRNYFKRWNSLKKRAPGLKL